MQETGDREPREFSGRDTRQGEIILRTRWRKAIFLAGLAGIVILAIALRVGGVL
jgi:hypothetical protein